MTTSERFLDSITPFELQLLCDYIDWNDFILQKNIRAVAWWAAAGKTKKKNMKIKEFWPLISEQYNGDTKMSDDKIKWFNSYKKQFNKKNQLSPPTDGQSEKD